MPEREFSEEEANALLPEIRRLLGMLNPAPLPERARDVVAGNGSAHGAAAAAGTRERHAEALERLLALGIVVRDLRAGLVDFPAIRNGEPVFLCWRRGESRVAFWHDRNSGFSGRSPL